MEAESNITCPSCGSGAWYHFGKTAAGKRRYICQACSRQFIIDYSHKSAIKNRPCCPTCGGSMHIYMRDSEDIRFRCAKYPTCRSFLKVELESLDVAHAHAFRTSPIRSNHVMRKEVVVK